MSRASFGFAVPACFAVVFMAMAAPVAGQDVDGADSGRETLSLDEIDPSPVVLPEGSPDAAAMSRRAERLVEKANELAAEQRYTEAGLELERALQSDPNSADVQLALARVLRESGSVERSRTNLRRAAELAPDDVRVQYLLAVMGADADVVERVHRYRMALACSNVEQHADVAALCWYRLAELLAEKGYVAAALDAYEQFGDVCSGIDRLEGRDVEFVRLSQTTRCQVGDRRAALLERLGKYEEAADALAEAATASPEDVSLQTRMARLLVRAGRAGEALEIARKLLERDASSIALFVEAHKAAGTLEQAYEELSAIGERRADDAVYHMALADVQRETDPAGAAATLAGFLERHPDHARVRWLLHDLYAEQGDIARAVGLLIDAVRLNSADAETARTKAVALCESKGDAVNTWLEQAGGDASADDHAAQYVTGAMFLSVGQAELGEARLRKALDLKPDFAAARAELAEVLLGRFEWRAVIALLDASAANLYPAGRLPSLLGRAHAGLDDVEKATTYLNAAIHANRADVGSMRALAELYERTERPLLAIRQYRAILDVNPLDEDARESLVLLQCLAGDPAAAREQLDELRRMAASANRIARCEVLIGLNTRSIDFDTFRERLQAAIDESEPDAKSLTLVGMSYLEAGSYPDSLEPLKRAAALDPNDVDTSEALHRAYVFNLQYDRAAEVLRLLLERHPNRHAWLSALVDVLWIDQDFASALDVLGRQLSRDDLPDEFRLDYRVMRDRVLDAAGRHAERIDALLAWREDAPDDTRIRRLLIDAYLAADRAGDALVEIEAAYGEQPTDLRVRARYVDLLARAGQPRKAVQKLLEWLGDDPSNDELIRLLTERLREAERYDDALELIDGALADTRNVIAFQFERLITLDAAGDHGEAVELLGAMLDESDKPDAARNLLDTSQIRRQIAVQLMLDGQFNRAQAKLTDWLDQASDTRERLDYLRSLAGCYQSREQRSMAIETLEQALALDPLDPGTCNDLAYSWADEGLKLEEGEKLIRYAVAREPRNGAYLDSLGWVLYKKGDAAGACHWLGRAVVAGAGDDPVVNDHLGDAFWRLGRKDQAVSHWQKAMDIARQRAGRGNSIREDEDARVADRAEEKINSVQQNQEPAVAPLGQDVPPTTVDDEGAT